MSNLKSTDKKILETLFEMRGGYVLDFSDKTMGDFFKEEFSIEIYDKKYNFDFQSKSKANRLRGIWLAEDDKIVGKIILSLVNYLETILLVENKEVLEITKDLIQKVRIIGNNLLLSENVKDIEAKKEENKVFTLPDINKSSFSEKVIDLVAEKFCTIFSNYDIRKIITPIIEKNTVLYKQRAIKGYLIDEMFEENPFDTFNDTLQTIRTKDENADATISKIIADLLHPLNHNADDKKTDIIASEIEKYLKYDNFYIDRLENEYFVFPEGKFDLPEDVSSDIEQNDLLHDKETILAKKELIGELRNYHQSYMDVLEVFCEDITHPTKELNDAYLFLKNKINDIIYDLSLQHNAYSINPCNQFEGDLYSAEMEWQQLPKDVYLGPISWDIIRPSLYSTHSNIIKLCNFGEKKSEMSDDEKELKKITNLISQKRTKKLIPEETKKPTEIRIVGMPDLNIKNTEENFIVKNNKKRITLPKFQRTEWAKVSIRFTDERNIILSNGKDTKPTSFEGLGCDDGRNGKPDENWNFLLRLAVGNGQTPSILKLKREKQKKQKQKITDILKKIFQNDSEPFETQSGGVYKAKFNIAYPINTDNKITKNKYEDLDKFHSEMTESSQENIKSEFSQ